MNPRGKRLLMYSPLIVAAFVLFVFIGGEIVMRLWNWLLPSIAGVRTIGFWEALGLLFLCRILFGGTGFAGGGYPRGRMGRRMRERCAERERFREQMRERWAARGDGGPQG